MRCGTFRRHLFYIDSLQLGNRSGCRYIYGNANGGRKEARVLAAAAILGNTQQLQVVGVVATPSAAERGERGLALRARLMAFWEGLKNDASL